MMPDRDATAPAVIGRDRTRSDRGSGETRSGVLSEGVPTDHVLKVAPALRSPLLTGTVPRSSRHPKETVMTTAKFLANRALMLLGTMAAFAFVMQGAKRW